MVSLAHMHAGMGSTNDSPSEQAMTKPREAPLTDAIIDRGDTVHTQSENLAKLSRRLERAVAELREALGVIVTHAECDHDGFTYSEIADYARKAIARLDGSKP